MKPTRLAVALALGLTATAALTACSSPGSGDAGTAGPQQSVAPIRGDGKTITVWVMNDDYSTETLTAINDEFTKQTGAKVNLQVQDWDGITTKITTALATSTPPDVLDLGNTQVASFAANGGLKDLTPYEKDLKQGRHWLSGLVDPATVDGQLYAVPGFAGARSVIYNKKVWAAAGITAPPATHAELLADLDKVRAANSAEDFSPLYLPGQNWYAGMQFVWDAGGEIAINGGGKWTPGFSSEKAQQGLNDFKEFQNKYSAPASRTVDTKSPDQLQIFADGKASAIIATSGAIGQIQKANPALTEADFGSFPLPGKSGKNQPVMLGGSDWGIAAKSQHADLAVVWVKIASSPQIQDTWVFGKEGWIPNSSEAIESAAAKVKPVKKGFFDAALTSKATPASANWAEIEGKKDLEALFAAVASGAKSPKDAAATFDAAAGKVLNASS